MTQLTHGGDWAGYRAQYGHDALDFSANVSPLGLPQGVANAIAAALPHADRYPDPLCRALRAKLAPHEGIPAESILCGNGAADLIFRLVWAAKPRTALVTAPTFAEYAAALESAGCAVRRHFLQAEVDFAVTDSILSSITPEVDMVFLCQPNNPTGQLTPLPLVERILRRCEACGALLVVDECFLDFLPDCDTLTAKALLDSKNLLILKAFTKLYGLPHWTKRPMWHRCGHSLRSSGPGSRPGCGHWACGYWTDEQTTYCSRGRKRWAMPCGSGAWCCAAAATTPGWTAAGTAPPCVPGRKTMNC